MRSALSIVIGLAARAELTLLDEPYAGLDAVARHLFYERLLADYAQHPRTVLLSTHLIDEVADLLEHVVMVDRGRIVLDAPADDVRDSAATVSGPAAAMEEFVAGRPIWHRSAIGPRASVTVAGPFDAVEKARASELNLSLEPLSLQQLMVHRLSRRSYYLGTIVLVLGLGAVYSLGIAVLQAVERAAGGWGVGMHFFGSRGSSTAPGI